MKKEPKLYYTSAEAAKLRDCEELGTDYVTWRPGRKFLRRGRSWATILIPMKGDQWFASSRRIGHVKVDGKILEYIGRYEFTNAKNPFKTLQKID